ncbi:TetR/AcrR family transcriptional regulator [Corynebacterium cystitidis]|uniref:Transcriptional regulator, TetR family n=1 Tax=Corynebacterium cystitidis DSM 20524 TaxID=1121357 RepID=A0A1H9SGN0_9CORY|nr:TetR/AcrR family transcriptional regulator [Corynebacterium cystitidis]WJY83034.1 HTH-type transcriptional regulator QacR [Corynebacterium cystitidis DSM 20524]SER84132.1 transcriptional regulator, TetR family [Corynebacterium cystitidis DSM 20524]SNV65133.1 transcriptional regulator [Corynebacterium cystitidis]
MARPREFDTVTFLRQAGELLVRRGYNATSIDEIVKVTGVARGSLYSIFGSKQGIFIAVLEHAAEQWSQSVVPDGQLPATDLQDDPETLLNLINVAVFEIASHSPEIAELIQRIIDTNGITAQALGRRALGRAGLTEAAGQSC